MEAYISAAYPHDAGWRNTSYLNHRASAPVTGIFGFGLQYLANHGLYLFIGNAARAT